MTVAEFSEVSYTHTDDDGDRVEVLPVDSMPAVIRVSEGPRECGAYYTQEQAVGLALAILEGAGWRENPAITEVDAAMDNLRAWLRNQLEEKAREAEEAKLEAEAGALREAWLGDNAHEYSAFASLTMGTQESWRAAARKARDLYGYSS